MDSVGDAGISSIPMGVVAITSIDCADFVVALSSRGRTIVKRDMDLIRHILIEIESRPDASPRIVELADYDGNVVFRHLEMLQQAGFIDVIGVNSPVGQRPPSMIIKDLTWNGHDFLNAIQSDTVWKKLKHDLSASNLISAPFEVIKFGAIEIAKGYLKQHIGIG